MHPTPRPLRYFASPALDERVAALVSGEHFDMLHVERLYMFESVRRVFQRGIGRPGPLRVLDLDDLESAKMKRTAAVQPWSSPSKYLGSLEWLKWRAAERAILPQFDCALVCSEMDRDLVGTFHRPRVEVFANGADLDVQGTSRGPEDDGRTVTFLGAMDYQPNEDAVLQFVHEVMPILRQRVPDVRFVIDDQYSLAHVL